MQVLVTGAGGFIGSHLVEALVAEGHQVRAFVRYNSRGYWGWLEEAGPAVRGRVDVRTGDVRDYDSVQEAVKGTELVFHLAALIGIPYSYASPLAYLRTNVEGTYNVLQAARETGVARVVQTSTSEVYGTARHVPIAEDHPLQAQSPYAASKIAADQLALSFCHSFGLPVTLVRPFNTFGPHQSARAVIPAIITQVLSGARVVKLGNLQPTRDLNYVADTVDGFLAAAGTERTVGEVVNVGSGREIAVGDLARLIAEVAGKEIEIVQEEERLRPPASEVERLVCDNRKMEELTGWRPRHTLEEGLRETLEWFAANLNRYKPEVYQV